MKIDYISDLHMDFYVNPEYDGEEELKHIDQFIDKFIKPNNDSDMIIIAGDVSHYNGQIISLFSNLSKRYKYIIYVIGNHELYLVSSKMRQKYKTSINKIDNLKKNLSNIDNLYFLDGDIIDIDGLKISGSDLYGDFNFIVNMGYDMGYAYRLWRHTLNDYNYIDFGKTIYIENHRYKFDPYRYFIDKKRKLKKVSKDSDIIVTHVPPMYIDTSFGYNDTSAFFHFDGSDIIENCNNLKYWIFGHIHEITSKKIGDMEFLSNPFGYPSEYNNFDGVKQIII